MKKLFQAAGIAFATVVALSAQGSVQQPTAATQQGSPVRLRLAVGIRKRNQAYLANGQYKFSSNFTMALEYRRGLTDWFREPLSNQRLNWASLGFLYSF